MTTELQPSLPHPSPAFQRSKSLRSVHVTNLQFSALQKPNVPSLSAPRSNSSALSVLLFHDEPKIMLKPCTASQTTPSLPYFTHEHGPATPPPPTLHPQPPPLPHSYPPTRHPLSSPPPDLFMTIHALFRPLLPPTTAPLPLIPTAQHLPAASPLTHLQASRGYKTASAF